MDSKSFFDNFETIANAPGGVPRLRRLILELAVSGRLLRKFISQPGTFPIEWEVAPAGTFFQSRSGNSKLIKGSLFSDPGPDRFPGFSASGQDVWLETWEHEGTAAILSAVGARCGKAFMAEGRWSAIANTHIIWLTDERISPRFALLFLNNEDFWIRSGSAQPFVKVKASLEQLVGIPSLIEQEQIVLEVDALMAMCDELESAQNQRDSIRTAACKSAIDSTSISTNPEELEDAWRRISNNWITIADTPESISSIRSLILDLAVHGLLSDPNVKFETVTMGAIFDVTGGLQKTPKRTPVRSHFPYLRVANVQRGRLDLAEISRFELSSDELEKYRLSPRDLLIVEGNGSEKEIGRCAIWNGEIQDCIHQNHIIRCRPKLPEVEKYALLFLNSPSGTRLMKSLAVTTSGLFTLSVGKIRAIEFQIPPVSEILKIVRKVDELATLCDEANNALLKRNLLGESLAKTMTRVVNA